MQDDTFTPRKRIEPYSAHGHEQEVLFAAGTRFQVLEVETVGKQTTIRMKEL